MYIYLRSSNSLHSILASALCKNEAILTQIPFSGVVLWLFGCLHAMFGNFRLQHGFPDVKLYSHNVSWIISNIPNNSVQSTSVLS